MLLLREDGMVSYNDIAKRCKAQEVTSTGISEGIPALLLPGQAVFEFDLRST